MTPAFQVLPVLGVVVYLSVADGHHIRALAEHGLVPSRRIHDAETPEAECDATVDIDLLGVGPSVA